MEKLSLEEKLSSDNVAALESEEQNPQKLRRDLSAELELEALREEEDLLELQLLEVELQELELAQKLSLQSPTPTASTSLAPLVEAEVIPGESGPRAHEGVGDGKPAPNPTADLAPQETKLVSSESYKTDVRTVATPQNHHAQEPMAKNSQAMCN